MHRQLLFLTALLLSFGGLHAQIASDGFDYDASGSIAGNGAAGDGWSSGWVTASDADTSLIGGGGVLNETLLARTASNRAVVVSTVAQNRFQRYFETPLDETAGEFWFSAHMAIDGNPAGNVGTMSLVDTTTNTEGVTVGKRFGNRNVFATGAGAGATNTGRQFQGTDARWLVGHMVFDDVAGNWTLDMWVDVDPSNQPAEASAQIQNKVYPNRTFHAVRIKSEGAAGIDYSVDDIYFGSTFADIIPDDLVTVPGLPAGAIETFNGYADGDSLAQVGNGGSGWMTDWNILAGLSPVIADGGIEYEAGMIATSGTRARATTDTRMVRRLDEGYGDFGRTYWVGYWFQTENDGANVSNFVLADADAFGATGQGGRLAQIGSAFNNPNIALVGVGGTGVSSADGHFVVLEIATNGTSEPDDIYIYLDPTAGAQPNREDANFAGRRNLTNWNAIALLQAGGGAVVANFDDIRVANDYAGVFADDYVDTSTPLTAIAIEPFTYEPGDLLGKGGPSNGWAGAWDTIASGEVVPGNVVTGGLVNSSLLARTSTNSATITSPGTANRYIRYLENPITPVDNDTVWFSFHAAMAGDVGGNVGTLVFADTTQDNYERIVVGKRFGNRNVFATGAGSGATNSGLQFEGADARWIVGRLAASDTSDNWILDVWVDPTPGTQPDEESANIADKLYPTANFNGISLKAEGGAGLDFRADDIYIGGVYADVVPDDFEAVTEAPEGAMETFDYAATDSLAGQMGGSGWDGAWTLASPANAPIAEGGIDNFTLLQGTSSNRASFVENGRLVRKLDGSYNDQGRTHWVGYWFDSENGGPNVTNLVIANFDDYLVGGVGELLQIGRSFNGSNIRIIGQGTSTTPANQGNFVVLELVSNGPDVVDSVYLWVNPALDETPDRAAAIRGNVNLANWDAIGLKVAGDPGVIAEWDDIYVGGTYQDVVPGDLEELMDPTEPVVAFEPFDYPVGSDLAGGTGGTGWLSGWEQMNGSILIAEGSVDSDRITGTGNKAAVSNPGGDVLYSRPYFARFASDSPDKQTVWVTFLTDVSDAGIGNNGGLSIMDGENALLTIGKTGGTSNIAISYGGQSQASTELSFVGTNWVVVQLDLYGAGVADTARVWVNPLSDVLPDPDATTFTITDLQIDNGFDRVSVSAAGTGDFNYFADEIYTGFSFRDVSPGFGSDDPDLLVYEPFNYSAGEPLVGQGGVNAFWDGTWEDASGLGEVNELFVTEGSIDQPELEEIGNKAEFGFFEPSVNMRVDRKLAFPIVSDGSTYWITFLMNTTQGEAMDNVSNMTLRSSGIAANGGQRLSIGRQFGDGLLGFVTPSSGNVRRSEVLDEGMHWLVMRIKTATEGVADSVAMWIDPPVGVEPDTATAFNVSNIGVLEGAPIDIIRFRVDGSGANQTPYVTNFDELRIARTWNSARLATNVIEPEEDDVFYLGAYPNPFGAELNVTFTAPRAGRYDLELIDLNGRVVSKVFGGELPAGDQQLRWTNTGLDNGIYLLRVMHGGQSTVRKLILYR